VDKMEVKVKKQGLEFYALGLAKAREAGNRH